MLGGQDVDATIELARKKGGTVKNINENHLQIEWEQDMAQGNQSSAVSPQRMRFVNRYNMKHGVPTNTEVFDASDSKLLSRTIHTYRMDKASGRLVPSRLFTDSYHHNTKTGKTEAYTEVATYRSFSFTENLD